MNKEVLFWLVFLFLGFLTVRGEEFHRLSDFTGDGEFFAVQNTLHQHNEVLIYDAAGHLLHTLAYEKQIVGTVLHAGKLIIFEGGGNLKDATSDSKVFRYKTTIQECKLFKNQSKIECNKRTEVKGGIGCPFYFKDQLHFIKSEYVFTDADWKFQNPKLARFTDVNIVHELAGPRFWSNGCPIVYGKRVHHATAGLLKKYEDEQNWAVELLIGRNTYEISADVSQVDSKYILVRSIPDLDLQIVSDRYKYYHRCVKLGEQTCEPDENFIGLSINSYGVYEAKMIPGTKEQIDISQLISF